MAPTRRAILDRALEMFNEQGLESVGVRDLARDLGLSPGNLSYYFPKKQDLVVALMDELADRNNANVAALRDARTLDELLTRYRRTFEAQRDYSFLPRAIVRIVESDPLLADRYRETELVRRRGLAEALRSMVGGELRPDTSDEALAATVGTFALVARFWLSEARISFPETAPDLLIDHYLAILAHALAVSATPAGRRSLARWLDGALVDEALGR